MKVSLVIFFLILLNLNVVNPIYSQSLQTHLENMVEEYLQLKESLANNDFERSMKYLELFSKEVIEYAEKELHQVNSEEKKRSSGEMVSAINVALKSINIEFLRDSFDEISKYLLNELEQNRFKRSRLYVYYCSQINNGNGAIWLSDKKGTQNPYYGNKEIKCGIIIKVLN